MFFKILSLSCLIAALIYFTAYTVLNLALQRHATAMLSQEIEQVLLQQREYSDCETLVNFWIERDSLFDKANRLLALQPPYPSWEYTESVLTLATELGQASRRVYFGCRTFYKEQGRDIGPYSLQTG